MAANDAKLADALTRSLRDKARQKENSFVRKVAIVWSLAGWRCGVAGGRVRACLGRLGRRRRLAVGQGHGRGQVVVDRPSRLRLPGLPPLHPDLPVRDGALDPGRGHRRRRLLWRLRLLVRAPSPFPLDPTKSTFAVLMPIQSPTMSCITSPVVPELLAFSVNTLVTIPFVPGTTVFAVIVPFFPSPSFNVLFPATRVRTLP